MSERKTALILFSGLLLIYLYVFPHWLDWNQNTRFDLTAAIVERGTLSIDAYAGNTGDYAEFNGHAYSDKAPGLSLLAAPIYALIRPITEINFVRSIIVTLGRAPAAAQTVNRPIDQVPPNEFVFAARLIVTTWLVVALPAALFGAWLYRSLTRFNLSTRSRALAVLTYGAATVAAPYSAALYGHQPAAMMLYVAFVGLMPRAANERPSRIKLFFIGSLLGFSTITEYPALLIAVLIGLYAIFTLRDFRSMGWLGAGALWPLIVLGAYNAAIFGTPFALTYQYVANPRLRALIETGVLSGGLPSLEALGGLTLSPFRGLFFTSPILLLAVAGWIGTVRQATQRREGTFGLIVVFTFTLFVSGSAQWWGGWSVGPRYLIPMLPWLVWPLGVMIDRLQKSRLGLIGLGLLIATSIVIVWSIAVGGQYYAPDDIATPLIDYSWPAIASGDVARNWGMLAGLPGAWSLLPPALILIAVFALVGRTTAWSNAGHAKS